jgi:hypothetical protein
MDIQAAKLEIMKLILETDNPEIINTIKKVFRKRIEKDFWETIPQSQKEDILAGIQEVKDGDIVDYENYIRKHK